LSARIREHIRSNLVGYVAVFIALSGTAYAIDGPLPGQNQVGSGDIINGEVQTADIKDANLTTADIRANAVTTGKIADGDVRTADVLDNNLTGADINEASLFGVDADTLDGKDSTEFAPSGQVASDQVEVAVASDDSAQNYFISSEAFNLVIYWVCDRISLPGQVKATVSLASLYDPADLAVINEAGPSESLGPEVPVAYAQTGLDSDESYSYGSFFAQDESAMFNGQASARATSTGCRFSASGIRG
jgi:hypothetical protein